MNDAGDVRRPALIIVAGPPGAGKTTLAHALARAVPCPAVCRDEIKEGLVCTVGDAGESSADLQRRATDGFFEVLALLLGHGVTVVAEAAFQHNVWAPRLESMEPIARVRVVLCELDADRARARRLARNLADPTHARVHPDAEARGEPTASSGRYNPPRLEVPTLRVDTSDGYQPPFDTIVEFARA